jgi:hypothetical protein
MAEKVKKEEEEKPDFASSYLSVDIESLLEEYKHGEQVGEISQVSEMDDVFRWMRGTINGWYGWANDGKGTFFDFMAVMMAQYSKWKFCMMKQEDISSTRYSKDGPAKITANRIHKGLAWTYTGKTPYLHYAEKYKLTRVERAEYQEALLWVDEHFKIIYPRDRRFKCVMDNFKFYYEKFGIDCFLIDPFKSLKLDDSKRTDFMMDDLFIECKEFAAQTNTSFNFIAHPKSLTDVRTGKDKDSPFKVVTQFMVSGGQAWDNNMDGQYSIFRPERHLNPADTKVHFYNLKQRNSEEVLAKRGVYEHIKFDPNTRRYFFNGICPLNGAMQTSPTKPLRDFSQPLFTNEVDTKTIADDEMPF